MRMTWKQKVYLVHTSTASVNRCNADTVSHVCEKLDIHTVQLDWLTSYWLVCLQKWTTQSHKWFRVWVLIGWLLDSFFVCLLQFFSWNFKCYRCAGSTFLPYILNQQSSTRLDTISFIVPKCFVLILAKSARFLQRDNMPTVTQQAGLKAQRRTRPRFVLAFSCQGLCMFMLWLWHPFTVEELK